MSRTVVRTVRRVETKKGSSLVEIDKGVGILRAAKPEEVVPGKLYYCKTGYAGTTFVETVFNSCVEWDSIVEMCRCEMVYVKNDKLRS